MKKYFAVVFLLFLSAGILLTAQKANPASDFKYVLNEDSNSAFFCNSIVSVVMPDSIIEVQRECFDLCRYLEKVILSKNLKSIGAYCFQSCYALKEIILPKKLEHIGLYAFSASALESITIPDSVVRIDVNAFSSCKKLKVVSIGSGIKYIGLGAFENCVSLVTYNIDVKKLLYHERPILFGDPDGYEGDVFLGCSSLSLKEQKKIRDTGYKGKF